MKYFKFDLKACSCNGAGPLHFEEDLDCYYNHFAVSGKDARDAFRNFQESAPPPLPYRFEDFHVTEE